MTLLILSAVATTVRALGLRRTLSSFTLLNAFV